MAQPEVFAGVRVVDFSTGRAGGQATAVLADFGADVIKVEPPAGDRFRTDAASPFWLRGKRSVVLDLSDSDARSVAQELVATADVVVAAGPPQRLTGWGIDGATLTARFPQLVHCTLTGWGVNGPYANIAGYEGLVAAKTGRMAAFDVQLNQNRPVFAAVEVATHIASQAAVQGIAAALYQREQTGSGDIVETSLVQALLPFDLVDVLSRQLATRDGRSFTPLRKMNPMPTLNYHPLRTSDGRWIQCGNLLEHLFYSFLDAVDLLGEFLIDEKFQGSPAVWTPEATEEARDRILLRMQEQTCDEWMRRFEENGNVAAEPIVTTQQAISHIDLVDGAGLVTVHDPIVGETTQIAAIAELTATPAVVDQGAPLLGQHTAEVLASLTGSAPPASDNVGQASDARDQGRPLAGVTIIDLSTIIAAPLGISMLADLGARVIKVEPYGGDPFRGLLIEGRMAVKTNLGKESICINLKTDEGQGLLHTLVRDADVLVHNFRGSVPDKLGIGYEQLRSLNPDLIWAVINGYGPHGPGAKRPATHPVMGAATGGVALQAGEALTRACPTLADVRENARQIMVANEANPDPNTSVIAASAIMLALVDRQRRGGQGQVVRINMQVANAWANGDDFLDYASKPPRSQVDADHYGLHAGYRLYPAASGWIFLAATTNTEFQALCAGIDRDDLAADPRFSGSAERRRNNDELAAELAQVFSGKDAAAWEQQLVELGVGCVQADGVEVDRFIAEDAHMVGNGWAPHVDHARFGRLRRWGQVVSVGGLNPHYNPAPLAGEHTDALLQEFGYDDDTIAGLRERKIITSESV